jgi:uncharacterized protein (TIGR02266 family)
MSQDTRKDPRAKIVSLNVRYKSATVDEFIDNHSHDVSKGGLFIKTTSPFPPGTLLKFEIRIAGDKAVIAGVGRVVWKRESAQAGPEQPAGMGVKFIKIDDSSRAVIDKLIESRGEGKNAYDEGVGEGGPVPVPAPSQPAAAPPAVHVPAASAPAVAARVQPKLTPQGLGGHPQPVPFKPAPSASRIPVAAGKQTMMGIGGIQDAIAQAKAGAAAPAAGRPSSEDARTKQAAAARAAQPAPAPAPASAVPSTTPMFPKTNSQADMPPKNEQTVMKQAAELLEEALRGAGGSMDEIGQNPLFDQVVKDGKDVDALLGKPVSDDGSQATVHGIGPVDLKDLMKPEATKAPNEASPSRSAAEPAVMLASDVDSTLRSAAGEEAPRAAARPKVESYPPKSVAKAISSERPAATSIIDEPAPKNRWLLPVIGLAAAGVLGFLLYSQVSEDTDKVPLDTPPPASASATASAEPAASASAAPSASTAPAASAAPETPSADAAAAAASASAAPSATTPPAPVVAAPVVQPRPQPQPRPKPPPPPAATDTPAPTATEAAPTPAPTATAAQTATAAPTATTPPPAPKPKPGKTKPEDDNPY